MQIQNGTTPTIVFLLVDESDDETAETGVTPTVQISKAGGAFATVTNAVTEISNGWYKVTLTATETNTDGALAVRAYGTGTDEWRMLHEVYTNLLTSTEANRIADIVLRRVNTSIEGSSYGETLALESLYGIIQMFTNASVSSSTKTVTQSDGSTTLGTQTLTTSGSAVPVIGITT